MERFISYLEARKGLNLAIVLLYFVSILLLHDVFVNLSVSIMTALTRSVYDRIVGGITLFFLAMLFFFFIKNVRVIGKASHLKLIYLLTITGLITIHSQMNFVMNIEIIHTIQFGILSLLIFPLTRSFGATLYYTVLFGAFDEWFQYSILYPEKNDYFDFNDLLLDQLGAALALLFLYSTGVENKASRTPKWYFSAEAISFAVLAITFTVLLRTSLITVYSIDGTRPLLTLSEASEPESFWRHLPNSDIVFHVITPLEGSLSILIICGLFFLLDFLAAKEKSASQCFIMTPDSALSHA